MKDLAQKVSDRAAEWITPWTGGSRLITLWEMKEYLAPRLTKLAREFSDAWGEFIGIGDEEGDKRNFFKVVESLDLGVKI